MAEVSDLEISGSDMEGFTVSWIENGDTRTVLRCHLGKLKEIAIWGDQFPELRDVLLEKLRDGTIPDRGFGQSGFSCIHRPINPEEQKGHNHD